MHENAFKWISLIFFVFGCLGIWYLITDNSTLFSPEWLADITIILFGFGYGYHLRTKKKWGFKSVNS